MASNIMQIIVITSPAAAVAKYCDQQRVSVCPTGYLQNHTTCDTSHLYETFRACCLWPWFGPPARWRNPKGRSNYWAYISTENGM